MSNASVSRTGRRLIVAACALLSCVAVLGSEAADRAPSRDAAQMRLELIHLLRFIATDSRSSVRKGTRFVIYPPACISSLRPKFGWVTAWPVSSAGVANPGVLYLTRSPRGWRPVGGFLFGDSRRPLGLPVEVWRETGGECEADPDEVNRLVRARKLRVYRV